MTEKLSTWGRGVTGFLVLLLAGGAIQGAAQGSRSGSGIMLDALLGVMAGWFGFVSAVVLFGIGVVLIAAVSGFIERRDNPDRVYSVLKWVALGIAALAATGLITVRTYSGLAQSRLIPAAQHFQECMRPQTKQEKVYFSNTCADGWVSPSDGRGRCSSHGGVKKPTFRERSYQPYTESQCKRRALARSWVD